MNLAFSFFSHFLCVAAAFVFCLLVGPSFSNSNISDTTHSNGCESVAELAAMRFASSGSSYTQPFFFLKEVFVLHLFNYQSGSSSWCHFGFVCVFLWQCVCGIWLYGIGIHMRILVRLVFWTFKVKRFYLLVYELVYCCCYTLTKLISTSSLGSWLVFWVDFNPLKYLGTGECLKFLAGEVNVMRTKRFQVFTYWVMPNSVINKSVNLLELVVW